MTARITVEGLQRLDAALAYIEAYPDEHEQRTWAWSTPCGTTYCLAGHVVVQAGAEIRWRPFDDDSFRDAEFCTYQGDQRVIAGLAGELLGVDYEDADDLFAAVNTLADLRLIRDELAATLEAS